MIKRLLLPVILGCTIVTSVQAQQYPYRMPYSGYGMTQPVQPMNPKPVKAPRPTPAQEAGVVLKQGLKKLLGFFSQNKAPSPELIAAFLDKEISPYFDFDYMAKWSAGAFYNRLNNLEKKEVANELKTRFLSTMAQKLSSFDKQSVRYLAPKVGNKGQVELSIAIDNRGGYPAKLDFRLYKSSNGWKVYDVSANGSSALVYYRQYFRQQRAKLNRVYSRPSINNRSRPAGYYR